MLTIGYIGFGEAAYYISKGLNEEGLNTQYAYDINVKDKAMGDMIRKRAKETAVKLTEKIEDLVEKCDIIICATSVKVMESIAESVKNILTTDHLYVDINAASSEAKQRVYHLIKESGAKFVDGAVMGTIPVKKHQTLIFLSGDGAQQFQKFGMAYNMDLVCISEHPGDASAIKMFRSIFMKGLAALLWETLESSYKHGVLEHVLVSLNDSLAHQSIYDLANNLLPRTAIHAERRVVEMEEVMKTLRGINVDHTLSKAIKEKLNKIAQYDMKKVFHQEPPKQYTDILQVFTSYEKEVTTE